MKITIETDDEMEAKRLIKSKDMAMFISHLQLNHFNLYKEMGLEKSKLQLVEGVKQNILDSLAEYGIDIDELIN